MWKSRVARLFFCCNFTANGSSSQATSVTAQPSQLGRKHGQAWLHNLCICFHMLSLSMFFDRNATQLWHVVTTLCTNGPSGCRPALLGLPSNQYLAVVVAATIAEHSWHFGAWFIFMHVSKADRFLKSPQCLHKDHDGDCKKDHLAYANMHVGNVQQMKETTILASFGFYPGLGSD